MFKLSLTASVIRYHNCVLHDSHAHCRCFRAECNVFTIAIFGFHQQIKWFSLCDGKGIFKLCVHTVHTYQPINKQCMALKMETFTFQRLHKRLNDVRFLQHHRKMNVIVCHESEVKIMNKIQLNFLMPKKNNHVLFV